MAGQKSISGEIYVFQLCKTAMTDIAMKPIPSCLLDNWQHFGVELIGFIRFLLLHNPRNTARSRPPGTVGGSRPAASDFGSSLLLVPTAVKMKRWCLK